MESQVKHQPLVAHNAAEDRLYRLQAEWRQHTCPKARMAIAQDIAQNPAWNIEITDDGPRFINGSQPPQKSTPTNFELMVQTNAQNKA